MEHEQAPALLADHAVGRVSDAPRGAGERSVDGGAARPAGRGTQSLQAERPAGGARTVGGGLDATR